MQDKTWHLLLLVALLGVNTRPAVSTPPTSSSSTAATTAPTTKAPSFCKTGHVAAYTHSDAPTTTSWAGNMLKAYHNLYHHNKKWYAVVDSSSNASSIDSGVSANTVLVKLPTTDTKAFQENVKVCYVPGVTLYIDFPFPAFPDNLGHWAELLLPVYSVFSNPLWRRHLQGEHQYIDRILLANVRPEILYNWPKEMLALSLDPALPPWPAAAARGDASKLQNAEHGNTESSSTSVTASGSTASDAAGSTAAGSTASKATGSTAAGGTTASSAAGGTLPPGAVPWDKPLPLLLGEANVTAWCKHGWMLFENLLVVQDRYHILSMPDRHLPQPPVEPAATAAAAEPLAAAAAAALHGNQCKVAGEQSDFSAVATCNGNLGAVPLGNAAEHSAEAAAAAELQEFWNSKYEVGFNQPALAAQFRAAAHARQLWGPPAHSSASSSSGGNSSASSSSGGNSSGGNSSGGNSSGGNSSGGNGSGGNGSGGNSSGGSSVLPRVVTVLLYPEDYPPVVNHYALVDMLRDLTEPYGFKVRTVSLTMGAPFLSHMATASDTGILIARHGPLLASAVFLPPGAAVVELLPYKWEWRGVSRLYYNMTQSTGYLHHWAWRPVDAKWCKYKDPAHARYAGWTASECQGRECLLLHAQAGLEVDLEAVKELLDRKIPGLLAGQSVEELAEPWPPAE